MRREGTRRDETRRDETRRDGCAEQKVPCFGMRTHRGTKAPHRGLRDSGAPPSRVRRATHPKPGGSVSQAEEARGSWLGERRQPRGPLANRLRGQAGAARRAGLAQRDVLHARKRCGRVHRVVARGGDRHAAAAARARGAGAAHEHDGYVDAYMVWSKAVTRTTLEAARLGPRGGGRAPSGWASL